MRGLLGLVLALLLVQASAVLLQRKKLPDACEAYSDLFPNIQNDLHPWAQRGINKPDVYQSILQYTSTGDPFPYPGISIVFLDGKAYLSSPLDITALMRHQQRNVIIYLQAIQDLQNYGAHIPNVEFVLATLDAPLDVAMPPHRGPRRTQAPLPVFRYCPTTDSTEISIPIFHFYDRNYTQSYLNKVAQYNAQYPWARKREALFGRFMDYHRSQHGGKHGLDGEVLTNPRSYFQQWANRSGLDLDTVDVVALGGPFPEAPGQAVVVPTDQWPGYKYLLHLDGIGCSARLEEVLAMGSVPFKESNAFRSFFHPLLRPWVHYVPVWRTRVDDVLDVLAWARQHDELARKVAQQAQAFALRYLNKSALACYWLALLNEYSQVMLYDPGASGSASGHLEALDQVIEQLRQLPDMQEEGAWPYIERPGDLGEPFDVRR